MPLLDVDKNDAIPTTNKLNVTMTSTATLLAPSSPLAAMGLAQRCRVAQREGTSRRGLRERQLDQAGAANTAASSAYYDLPGPEFSARTVSVGYHQEPSLATGGRAGLLSNVIERTPKPKGKACFSSVHVVCAQPGGMPAAVARCLDKDAELLGMGCEQYTLPRDATAGDPMREWAAIFELASSLILRHADRASLVVFVGGDDPKADAFAAFIGMLPFRGLATALLSQHAGYDDALRCETPSTVFEVDARQGARMGMYPLSSVFGPLGSKDI